LDFYDILLKMASTTSRIRNSLNSLAQTVLDESMSGNIEVNNAVSHAFLERHRIRLVSHDFENPEIQGYNPPVLFAPSPQSFLDVHPIQPEKCDDPRLGNPFYQFLDYEPGGKWMQPTECAHGLFRYMEKWAYTGFPRRDTDFIDSLQSKKGITPIR
jgi:hypothetical protein